MRIDTGSEQSFENATMDDLKMVLSDYDVNMGLVALTLDSGELVQISGNPDEGFVIQKMGEDGDLFRAVGRPVSPEKAFAFIEKAASGDSSWNTDFQWEREGADPAAAEGKAKGGCAGVLLLVVVAGWYALSTMT